MCCDCPPSITPGQGSLTVPGCVAATPIEQSIDIEEGYQLEAPLVYFFGHASPGDNPDYYRVRDGLDSDWGHERCTNLERA